MIVAKGYNEIFSYHFYDSIIIIIIITINEILLFPDVTGLQITDLTVPRSVRNGSNYVILDCQYALLPDDLNPNSGLVVKWFYNNSPSPVYQWIPGNSKIHLKFSRENS